VTVITEVELREMWQGGRGVIPPLPRDTHFTPSARDFVKQWGITITFLEGSDKEASSPVFAPQTGPRLVFRGKLDTLHAHFLLAAAQARRFNLPELADYLSTLAAYCREIASAESNERPVAPLQLAGLTEAEIGEGSPRPDRALEIPRIVPGLGDHEILLQLNLLHCQTRETELVVANVFARPESQPTRPDLIVAMNRLSSAVYYLILLLKAGKIAWKMPGGLG
jgi:ethanolamine utilization cobalamin adenosyltransferase